MKNIITTLLSKVRLWWDARGKQKMLKISKDAWSIAYGHVKAVDRLDLSDAAKLDAVQNAICEEVSPLVGYPIHPGELTKRLAQACHLQLRLAQFLGVEPPTKVITDQEEASETGPYLQSAARVLASRLADSGAASGSMAIVEQGKTYSIQIKRAE